MTVFRFVERERASYPVSTMCRVLGVSPSGFWAWRSRHPSARDLADAALARRISDIHRASRGTYGAPRIHAELMAAGVRCARKRVARLMRAAGLAGVHRRRRITRRVASAGSVHRPDLVQRQFAARAADQLWVADITHLPTQAGVLYLAVVIDAWSRSVVGWSMANRARSELVGAALEMALTRRRPTGNVIHHSDRGSQYTSFAFGRRLVEAGISASVGSVGDAYDNALAESFFASLETELIDRSTWATRDDARVAVFEYIEAFYNRRRRHSALGYLSPDEFERRYRPENVPVA
jgi:putative transposase